METRRGVPCCGSGMSEGCLVVRSKKKHRQTVREKQVWREDRALGEGESARRGREEVELGEGEMRGHYERGEGEKRRN